MWLAIFALLCLMYLMPGRKCQCLSGRCPFSCPSSASCVGMCPWHPKPRELQVLYCRCKPCGPKRRMLARVMVCAAWMRGHLQVGGLESLFQTLYAQRLRGAVCSGLVCSDISLAPRYKGRRACCLQFGGAEELHTQSFSAMSVPVPGLPGQMRDRVNALSCVRRLYREKSASFSCWANCILRFAGQDLP